MSSPARDLAPRGQRGKGKVPADSAQRRKGNEGKSYLQGTRVSDSDADAPFWLFFQGLPYFSGCRAGRGGEGFANHRAGIRSLCAEFGVPANDRHR